MNIPYRSLSGQDVMMEQLFYKVTGSTTEKADNFHITADFIALSRFQLLQITHQRF